MNYTSLGSTEDGSTLNGTNETIETSTENFAILDTSKRMGPIPTTIYTLIGLIGKNCLYLEKY